VAEVERNLKLQDALIKFMTVQTGAEVDLHSLQIDPEETKLGLGHLEPAQDEDKEESREKQLGLVDLGPEAARPSRAEDTDEFERDETEETEEGEATLKEDREREEET
jgi:hypothetical protein